MALNTNALVSLSNTKTFLKITDSTWDTILEILINSISTTFDKIVKRNLAVQTYSNQLYDGNNKRRLYLKHYPINSVSALEEDDVALTEGADEDFIIYSARGYLLRVSSDWSEDYQNIDVSYNAGYTAISRMNFDSGSEEPVIGNTLTSTSGSGVITEIHLTSGVWGSGTAVGVVVFSSITGEFADNETVDISGGNSDVMTVNEPGGSAIDSPGIPGDLQLAAFKQLGKEWKEQDKQEWGETSRSFPDGSITLIAEDLLPFVIKVLGRYERQLL